MSDPKDVPKEPPTCWKCQKPAFDFSSWNVQPRRPICAACVWQALKGAHQEVEGEEEGPSDEGL